MKTFKLQTFLKLILFSFFYNCTLTPPPITFTQTATAAEKQMLGEDKNIEKDGWILSSIRTSATGSDVWEREILDSSKEVDKSDEEMFMLLRKMAYFSGEVRDYKRKGYMGEALDGNLKSNPRIQESEYLEEYNSNKERIFSIIPKVNETRKAIYNKRILAISNNIKEEKEREKRKKELLLAYYKSIESGEYYEASPGSWKRKE
ncbi:MAG: DUF1318 domain-containing protein [Leptospiraceae bacterium]|nr:DUF1318 domain-containing protein [Leptospiraceae bacterium]